MQSSSNTVKSPSKKTNTFIIPIIRTDLIRRCLETLYRYTPDNFYIYVVDQSPEGIDQDIIDKYIHLYLRPYRNLGFAKATNEGIKLVETPYFTMCNDDVEFINKGWWQGILDTFKMVDKATPDKHAMMVNPASLKLPDWSVGRPQGEDFYILPYRQNYSQYDWDFLVKKSHYINKHLTIMPGSVIDGVTMYCSVFKTDKFLEVSMLNEAFRFGGGEDYDYNCRANMKGYRCVGTTLSWIFHHWSKSFESIQHEEAIKAKTRFEDAWNNNDELWGKDFDIWETKSRKGNIPPIGKYSL